MGVACERLVPRQDAGQPQVADGTAPAAKGSSRLIPLGAPWFHIMFPVK